MNSSRQPTLADLTSRSMVDRASSSHESEDGGDVEPHEVIAGIRVDALAAWADAQLPLTLLGVTFAEKSTPPDWLSFVEWNSGRIGIPMAAGHIPQRLRDVAGLFAADLMEAPASRIPGFAPLIAWIDHSQIGPDLGSDLLASGIARELNIVPARNRGTTPVERNEHGADLWCRGDCEGALAVWESMPVGPITSFNTGMASLMLGRPQAALVPLRDAVAGLPEKSGWHHLAALYLSVARVRN